MGQAFRLVESNWWDEMGRLSAQRAGSLRIVCPFIKVPALQHLLSGNIRGDIEVITRFAIEDWASGVSDHLALRLLLERGARVRGVRHLHAKLYIFGEHTAVLGSTNLTSAALRKNHELGAVLTGSTHVRHCATYFHDIWKASGPDLTPERLAQWVGEYELLKRATPRTTPQRWPDYGVRVPALENGGHPAAGGALEAPSARSFVKFFGTSDNRWTPQHTVLEELHRSRCHWACGYPKNRRPRHASNGDIVFMARLIKDPVDTIIFGRARVLRYVEGRDEATAEDIQDRPWRRDWPHYLRVINPELIDGNFSHGVSLAELMDELGSDSFVSTQENARNGRGNTSPRASLGQKPHARLTPQSFAWLNERLEQAFSRRGRIDLTRVSGLTWPEHARALSPNGRELLAVLRRSLSAEEIDVEDPATFMGYRDAVSRLGLKPIKGPRLADQLRSHSLDDLDAWTRRFHFPAITGLIVNHHRGHRPGKTFFDQHGRSHTELDWWREEVRAAAAFEWDKVL